MESILERAARLGLAEKEALLAGLRRLIAEDLARGGEGAPAACPRCGSARLARKGRSASGAQRWLCGSCGRTFSASTRSVLGSSKLPPEKWAAYAEGMLAGRTLRELASGLGVCLKTSWFMRARLCELMGSRLAEPRSGDGVEWQVDGTYLDESLKGNRLRARTAMPRAAHGRGGAVRARGISRLKVCVVCGASDLGDSFCELAARGRPTAAQALAACSPAAGAGRLVTDEHRAYLRVGDALGASSRAAVKAGTAEAARSLGLVNALHSRLKRFLARFNGVSTRRLPLYLAWFSWLEQTKRADGRRDETLRLQLAGGRYRSTRVELEAKPQPFWSFWEQRCVSNLV